MNHHFVLEKADELALAVLDLVDAKRLSTRSKAGDALISYADARFKVHGDGINKLRKLKDQTDDQVQQRNCS